MIDIDNKTTFTYVYNSDVYHRYTYWTNVMNDKGGIVKGYLRVICVITSIDHNQHIKETIQQQADVYRIVQVILHLTQISKVKVDFSNLEKKFLASYEM